MHMDTVGRRGTRICLDRFEGDVEAVTNARSLPWCRVYAGLNSPAGRDVFELERTHGAVHLSFRHLRSFPNSWWKAVRLQWYVPSLFTLRQPWRPLGSMDFSGRSAPVQEHQGTRGPPRSLRVAKSLRYASDTLNFLRRQSAPQHHNRSDSWDHPPPRCHTIPNCCQNIQPDHRASVLGAN